MAELLLFGDDDSDSVEDLRSEETASPDKSKRPVSMNQSPRGSLGTDHVVGLKSRPLGAPKTPGLPDTPSSMADPNSNSLLGTPSLVAKLGTLDSMWKSRTLDRTDLWMEDDEDDASLLSMESAGAPAASVSRTRASAGPPRRQTPGLPRSLQIADTPDTFRQSDTQSLGGGFRRREPVYERLYRQAKHIRAKGRNHTPRSQASPTTMSASSTSSHSVSAKTLEVCERLYRNEKRPRPSHKRFQPGSPASDEKARRDIALERRLNYTPSGGSVRTRSSRPRDEDDRSLTSNASSVWERLYRNEPRPRTQFTDTSRSPQRKKSEVKKKEEFSENVEAGENREEASVASRHDCFETNIPASQQSPLDSVKAEPNPLDSVKTEPTVSDSTEPSRSSQAMEEVRREEAAGKIWRAWQAGRARRIFLGRIESATRIQTYWRSYQCRHDFRGLVGLICRVQGLWRGYVERRARTVRVAAAIRLQRIWKRHYTRTQVVTTGMKVRALAVVVSFLRWSSQRRGFLRKRRAVVKIQSVRRMHVRRRYYIKNFVVAKLENSLSRLESSTHTRFEWKEAIDHRDAAVQIQAFWRSARERFSFLFLRKKVVLVQSLQRARQCRHSLGRAREAALSLQRRLRGAFVRRRLTLQNSAATKITSWWRMMVVVSEFQHLVVCALYIQTMYRGHCARRSSRELRALLEDKERLNKAASTLQTSWRRRQCVLAFAQAQCSIITIQAAIRGKLARPAYFEAQEMASLRSEAVIRGIAAVKVQNSWRRLLCQLSYQRTRLSVVMIQAAWRSRMARKELAKLRFAVGLKGQILRESSAALKLQRFIRRVQCRRVFEDTCLAVVFIQAVMRGKLARLRFETMRTRLLLRHQASVRVQNQWRRYICRSRYLRTRRAVVVIQSFLRFADRRSVFLATRAAVTMMQTIVRGSIVRQEFVALRERLEAEDDAAVTLQRIWRGSYNRWRYAELRARIVVLQAVVRRMLARLTYDKLRLHLEKEDDAVVCLQRMLRGHVARQELFKAKAAVKVLQRACRGRLARMKVDALLRQRYFAALRVQSKWRGFTCRSTFVAMRVSATMIQAASRGKLARQEAFALRCLEEAAAVALLQRIWRGYSSRLAYVRKRMSAILIQANVRRMFDRNNFEVLRSHGSFRQSSAVRIQSRVRGLVARSAYRQSRAAAIMIQAAVRGALARDVSAMHVMMALRLQSKWRCCEARAQYLRRRVSILMLQAAYRRWRARVQWLHVRSASICIQARIRSIFVRRELKAMESSVKRVQTFWRCRRSRLQYAHAKAAASVLQASFRRHWDRLRYTSLRKACVALQARLRAADWHWQFKLKRTMIIRIQRQWRRILWERNLAVREEAATHLQAVVRGWMTRAEAKLSRAIRASLRATWDQGVVHRYTFRQYLHRVKDSAKKIQITYVAWKMEMLLLELESATILLQRRVRGPLWRSNSLSLLQHINSAFKSSARASFVRVMGKDDHNVLAAKRKWKKIRNIARHCAAIVVQRMSRGFLCRLAFQRMRRLQRCGSDLSLHQTFGTSQFQRTPVAVKVVRQINETRIQVELCRLTRLQQHRAACVLQRAIGLFLRRQREIRALVWYVRQRRAVRIIQSAWRTCVLRQLERQAAVEEFQKCRAARLVQGSWRRCLRHERELMAAAVLLRYDHCARKIQTCYRNHVSWRVTQLALEDLRYRHAVRIIQTACKAYIQQQQDIRQVAVGRLRERWASRILQSACLSFIERHRRREAQCESILQLHSARIIQRYWRSYIDTRRLAVERLRLTRAIHILQRSSRAYMKHKRTLRAQQEERDRTATLEILRRHVAARKVQSVARAFLEVRNQLAAVELIQRWFRGILEKRHRSAQQLRRYGAACRIQVGFRDFLERRRLRQIKMQQLLFVSSARKVQKCIRGFLQRRKGIMENVKEIRKLVAVRRIQCWLRGLLHQRQLCQDRQERLEHLLRATSVRKLQMMVRGYSQRRKDRLECAEQIRVRVAARKTQDGVRDYIRHRRDQQAKVEHILRIASVRKLQMMVRGYLQRRKDRLECAEQILVRVAARKIQDGVRDYIRHRRDQQARVERILRIASVRKLQILVRGYLQRRKDRLECADQIRMRVAIRRVQYAARVFLRHLHSRLVKVEERRRQFAARKLQRTVRAYQQRIQRLNYLRRCMASRKIQFVVRKLLQDRYEERATVDRLSRTAAARKIQAFGRLHLLRLSQSRTAAATTLQQSVLVYLQKVREERVRESAARQREMEEKTRVVTISWLADVNSKAEAEVSRIMSGSVTSGVCIDRLATQTLQIVGSALIAAPTPTRGNLTDVAVSPSAEVEELLSLPTLQDSFSPFIKPDISPIKPTAELGMD